MQNTTPDDTEGAPQDIPQQHTEDTGNATATLLEAETREYVSNGPTIETVRAMRDPVRARRSRVSTPHVLPLAQRAQDSLIKTEGSGQVPERPRRSLKEANSNFQRRVQQAQQGKGRRPHISPETTARRLRERAQESITNTSEPSQTSKPDRKLGMRVSAELERRAQRLQKSHAKGKKRKK